MNLQTKNASLVARLFNRDMLMVCVFVILCTVLAVFDFVDSPNADVSGEKCKASVVEVDNSAVVKIGLLLRGEQRVKLKILSGSHKGEIFDAQNLIRAQMDLDKVFELGDTAIAAIPNGAVAGKDVINAQDHYRIDKTLLLFGLFAFLLLAFGGFTGFKALLSFVFACLLIWKVVVPACLAGVDAILVCLVAVCTLSAVIIFLVAGFTRKGFAAFSGTMLGVLASCIMAWIFTDMFKVNGSSMPYAQALLYSGYDYLDLSAIFIGALFLSSSGAVMDLSMDVAAGMDEVFKANSSLSRKELICAGISIGRSVVGTMTTTLLLAYVGGYLTLMMTFFANNVSVYDFLNNPHVSSEVVKTIVGSFGLVLVAPFTAIVGGVIIAKKPKAAK